MVSNNLLDFASETYDFDKKTLHFISNSTNEIYAFNKKDKRYILRFSQKSPEYVHKIKAEMDWLYYLAKNGMNVSLPLMTDKNEFTAITEDNGKGYILTSFETVSGTFWDKNNPDKWNDRIFFNWGKAVADMHLLTKSYVPKNDMDVRSTFTGRNALNDKIKECPQVNEIVESLINEMMKLPKDRDSYGLIHYDVHPWNFYIEGDKINVFDFDDSLYGWFALDIGIALYHGLWWGRKNEINPPHDFSEEMITNFLKGYLSVNKLDGFWLKKIPMFMKFRQICRLSWFFDPVNIDEQCKELMNDIKNDILFSDCKIEKSLFLQEIPL